MIRIDSAFSAVQLIADNALGTATITSGTLDVSQFEGNALLVASFNGDTNGTLDITVKDSADGTTYSAVGTEALFVPATGAGGTFAGVNAGTDNLYQVRGLNLDKVNRYVIVSIAAAYTGSGHVIALAPVKYANFS